MKLRPILSALPSTKAHAQSAGGRFRGDGGRPLVRGSRVKGSSNPTTGNPCDGHDGRTQFQGPRSSLHAPRATDRGPWALVHDVRLLAHGPWITVFVTRTLDRAAPTAQDPNET